MTAPLPPAFTPAALLFDCDGTLLLTAEIHFAAMAEATARQGLAMPRDWYMALTGLGRVDLFARFAQDFALSLDHEALVRDSIAATVARAEEARENPEVADLARRAAGRLPQAVVTNAEGPIVHAFLAATGLAGLFDAVLPVTAAPRPKPAPDLYRLAADRLGQPPATCLVLEDSTQGLAAARAAGAPALDVRQPDHRARLRGLIPV